MMRITVDIDEATVAAVQKSTGIEGKSPAVARAVNLYLLQERRKKLIARALEGKTNYSASNELLEKRSKYDAH